jgi:hypothetical protein
MSSVGTAWNCLGEGEWGFKLSNFLVLWNYLTRNRLWWDRGMSAVGTAWNCLGEREWGFEGRRVKQIASLTTATYTESVDVW